MELDKYEQLESITYDIWKVHNRLEILLCQLCETKGKEYRVFKNLIEEVFKLQLKVSELKKLKDTLVNQEIDDE